MKFFKRITAIILVALFAFSPFACGLLSLVGFAADGNDDFINAEIHYGACMDSVGPEFTHVYDGHSDPDCNLCGKECALSEDFVVGDLDDKEGVDPEDAV